MDIYEEDRNALSHSKLCKLWHGTSKGFPPGTLRKQQERSTAEDAYLSHASHGLRFDVVCGKVDVLTPQTL